MKRGRVLQLKEPNGADCPAGCGFDTLGQLGGTANCSLQDAVQVGVIGPEVPGKSHDVRDEVSEVCGHGESICLEHRVSKRNLYMISPHSAENRFMDAWAHRTRFKELAGAYRKAKGTNRKGLAEALGLKEATLDGYLYGSIGKPSLEVLQLAASLFGCSVLEFIDDPGDDVEGIAPLARLSEAKRLVGRLIFKDIASEDVSDEQALAYLKAFQAIKALKDIGGK